MGTPQFGKASWLGNTELVHISGPMDDVSVVWRQQEVKKKDPELNTSITCMQHRARVYNVAHSRKMEVITLEVNFANRIVCSKEMYMQSRW